jgi:glycosyltransferase involved in cell wall biosynthesis
MLRVLVLCEHPTVLGGERSWLATVEMVRRSGIDLAVAAPSSGPLSEICHKKQIKLLPFNSLDLAGRRLDQPRRREKLAQLIDHHSPDLIHANSLSMGRLVGPVARELEYPSVAHLRDIIKLSARATADLNQNDRLLAVSDATRDFHIAAGLDADKTLTLYNGVDLDQFAPREKTGYLHRELGLDPQIPLIGTVGQIGLRKGHDTLLAAAKIICRLSADVHFTLVGHRWSTKDESRQFEAKLREEARQLGGRFHFLGIRDDVDRLMNEWTALAHPARQEPLGRVLLEASAAGLPVVATDVGGTREIFTPELELAKLIEPDDPDALADAISQLLDAPELRKKMAQALRARAIAKFDQSTSAAGLINHYRQVARCD